MCCKVLKNQFLPAPAKDWCNNSCDDPNIKQINEEVCPSGLADRLADLAIKSFTDQSRSRTLSFYDEEYNTDKSFRRSCILIILGDSDEERKLFHQFFNGRCGYRAMYWRCPELGASYNYYFISTLLDKLKSNAIAQRSKLFAALDLYTFEHTEAKVWPFYETQFLDSPKLTVKKWEKIQDERKNKTFNPNFSALIVKGAFFNGSEFKTVKECRSGELHEKGLT